MCIWYAIFCCFFCKLWIFVSLHTGQEHTQWTFTSNNWHRFEQEEKMCSRMCTQNGVLVWLLFGKEAFLFWNYCFMSHRNSTCSTGWWWQQKIITLASSLKDMNENHRHFAFSFCFSLWAHILEGHCECSDWISKQFISFSGRTGLTNQAQKRKPCWTFGLAPTHSKFICCSSSFSHIKSNSHMAFQKHVTHTHTHTHTHTQNCNSMSASNTKMWRECCLVWHTLLVWVAMKRKQWKLVLWGVWFQKQKNLEPPEIPKKQFFLTPAEPAWSFWKKAKGANPSTFVWCCIKWMTGLVNFQWQFHQTDLAHHWEMWNVFVLYFLKHSQTSNNCVDNCVARCFFLFLHGCHMKKMTECHQCENRLTHGITNDLPCAIWHGCSWPFESNYCAVAVAEHDHSTT